LDVYVFVLCGGGFARGMAQAVLWKKSPPRMQAKRKDTPLSLSKESTAATPCLTRDSSLCGTNIIKTTNLELVRTRGTRLFN